MKKTKPKKTILFILLSLAFIWSAGVSEGNFLVWDQGNWDESNWDVACKGDLDLDGKVDGSDFLLFRDDWGRTDCSSAGCVGDLDGDGKVDGSDFLIFRDNWGNVCPQ